MDIQLKVQKEMKKQVQVATQGPTQMTWSSRPQKKKKKEKKMVFLFFVLLNIHLHRRHISSAACILFLLWRIWIDDYHKHGILNS